jgi:hypothetical protein
MTYLQLFVVAALGAQLTGCAFISAVTFKPDEKTSFKRDGSKAHVDVLNQEKCRPLIATEFIPPAVIAAVAAIGLNIAESEIEDYLDKKKKEFTAAYGAMENVGAFYHRSTQGAYDEQDFKCIEITRTFKSSTNLEPIAFQWIGELVPNDSRTAYFIRTVSLQLNQAAAKTDMASRKVDVSVEVKIDATTIGDKEEISTATVADKTLAYQGLVITPEKQAAVVDPAVKEVTSSWFPAFPRSDSEIKRCTALGKNCKGVTALNIAILVTEVGSGGDAFGTLGKQIDDNKKTLNDAISKAITDALTPKSGGSSGEASKQ